MTQENNLCEEDATLYLTELYENVLMAEYEDMQSKSHFFKKDISHFESYYQKRDFKKPSLISYNYVRQVFNKTAEQCNSFLFSTVDHNLHVIKDYYPDDDVDPIWIIGQYVEVLAALQYIYDAVNEEPDIFLLNNPDRVKAYRKTCKSIEVLLEELEKKAERDFFIAGLKQLRSAMEEGGVNMNALSDYVSRMKKNSPFETLKGALFKQNNARYKRQFSKHKTGAR